MNISIFQEKIIPSNLAKIKGEGANSSLHLRLGEIGGAPDPLHGPMYKWVASRIPEIAIILLSSN